MPSTRVRVRRQQWFRVAALSALATGESERELARTISDMTEDVSRGPVREFLRDDFARIAARTVIISDPKEAGVHVELMLFRRAASNVPFLLNELQRRKFVVRVEELAGVFNVLAEVAAPTRADASDLAEEFTADERLIVLGRLDRAATGLAEAAKEIYATRG